MTDYQRTITRETTMTDPTVPVTTPTRVVPSEPVAATSVRTTERAYVDAGPSGPSVIARAVIFLFGILQVALILRIILLLLVANPANDVVALILGVTDPFVEPFRGMFALDRVAADQGSVLDVAAIVALIGWTLVEALILALLRVFDRRTVVTA
ncbi:MAG TPA: YggT family protein [Candidatus Limnocylindrales bacterium]